jgi:hypothetical protein
MLWLRSGNTVRNWSADRPGAPGCGSSRKVRGHVPTPSSPNRLHDLKRRGGEADERAIRLGSISCLNSAV